MNRPTRATVAALLIALPMGLAGCQGSPNDNPRTEQGAGSAPGPNGGGTGNGTSGGVAGAQTGK